jgi:hypothetical protein
MGPFRGDDVLKHAFRKFDIMFTYGTCCFESVNLNRVVLGVN